MYNIHMNCYSYSEPSNLNVNFLRQKKKENGNQMKMKIVIFFFYLIIYYGAESCTLERLLPLHLIHISTTAS